MSQTGDKKVNFKMTRRTKARIKKLCEVSGIGEDEAIDILLDTYTELKVAKAKLDTLMKEVDAFENHVGEYEGGNKALHLFELRILKNKAYRLIDTNITTDSFPKI